MFQAVRMIGLENEVPVIEGVLEDLEKTLLPGIIGLLAVQREGDRKRYQSDGSERRGGQRGDTEDSNGGR